MASLETVRKLFEPPNVGGVTLTCRFVASAMTTEAFKPWPSDRALRFYRSIGAGGAGAVITGEFQVDRLESDKAHRDGFVGFVERLSALLRDVSCPLVVQLGHSSHRTHNVPQFMGPKGPLPGEVDPLRVAQAFGRFAQKAFEAGASAVQIRCCHGSLLDSFLTAQPNPPGIKNPWEPAAMVLDTCLPHGPVWVKVGLGEEVPEGYGVEEGLTLALELAKRGAHLIEVTSGTFASKPPLGTLRLGVSSGESEAHLAPQCRRLSTALRELKLNTHVMLSGGIRSIERAADLLEEGVCSAVSMGRPFIAESDLVNRWKEDDRRPSACFSCNACVANGVEFATCPVMREKEENFWNLRSPD
ncbi:MAG: hypothetical protein N2315_02460 [Thermanaerothrix sp.]|nr:hypothetical protein [Thermanaerothrix sp.]